jgi:type II secretory pathway pseudopilin PulG
MNPIRHEPSEFAVRPGRAIRRRATGFTLFELLVVLAIFMVIATLATPFLLRTFSTQALKGGGDQVRAAFDRARVQAIRTGNVFAFLYRANGGEYTIAPLINSYSLVNPSMAASLGDAPAMKQLPQGLLFAGSSVSDDARAQFESGNSQLAAEGMTPILFYPDGTSQDAYVFVRNQQGEQIRIYLRGLTGMSSLIRVTEKGGRR